MTDEDDLGPGCLSCAAFVVCMLGGLVAIPAIIVAEAVAGAVNFIFSKTKTKTKKKERTR